MEGLLSLLIISALNRDYNSQLSDIITTALEKDNIIQIPTFDDELDSIQTNVIEKLKWTHGVPSSQLQTNVDVFLGCVT